MALTIADADTRVVVDREGLRPLRPSPRTLPHAALGAIPHRYSYTEADIDRHRLVGTRHPQCARPDFAAQGEYRID